MKRLLLGTILFYTFNCHADDQCRDILVLGMSQETRQSESLSKEADRLYYCSASLSEAKSYFSKQRTASESKGGSLSINLGPFGLDGGGSGSGGSAESITDEKYELWKSSNCSESERDRYSQAFDYLARKAAADSVVKAWRDCMSTREGLSCWVDDSETTPLFFIRWMVSTYGKAKIKSSYISGGKSEYDGAPEKKLLPTGEIVDEGETNIPITRESPTIPVNLSLNLSYAGSNRQCSAYIPSIKVEGATSSPSALQKFIFLGVSKNKCSLLNKNCEPIPSEGLITKPNIIPAPGTTPSNPIQYNVFKKQVEQVTQ